MQTNQIIILSRSVFRIIESQKNARAIIKTKQKKIAKTKNKKER